MIYILLIALSLALDAFAVSVTSGLTVKGFNIRHALWLGLYFGMFQFIMPILGWLMGSTVSEYISKLGPYISFLLLAFIGGKMIWTACSDDDNCETSTSLSHSRMLLLAIATSIDALAVGVTFAFDSDVNILLWSGVIGIVAFVMSIIGGLLGGKLSGVFKKRAEIVGGIVLIAIGIKILVESFF